MSVTWPLAPLGSSGRLTFTPGASSTVSPGVKPSSSCPAGRRSPSPSREPFERLAEDGWLSSADASPRPAIAGFRDVRVRGHVEGAPDIVRDVVLHQLGDLERLVAAVRAPL
jgi:hypothetical protein